MKTTLLQILLLALFSGACAAQKKAGAEPSITNAPAASTGIADPQAKESAKLKKQLEEMAAEAKGRVGVTAEMLESGERIGFNNDGHFPMQSVYKLPIAMAVMRQIDEGKIKLTQKVKVTKSDFVGEGQYSPIRDSHPNGTETTVEELLRLTVSQSDGTTSDVLLGLIGGAEAAQKYLQELGIQNVTVKNSEKEIARDWQVQYDNWATPDGAVALLQMLHEGRAMSEQSRTHLLKLMTEAIRGDKRLKALLPRGTPVAHRTGSSGSRDGITAATNNIGIVTLPNGKHFAIAVFVSDSPADEATREAVIAKIAKAVWDEWNK